MKNPDEEDDGHPVETDPETDATKDEPPFFWWRAQRDVRPMKVSDVFAGRATWGVDCCDALAWLRGLPADSVDMVFGSPPYESARLYLEGGKNLGIARKTKAWVAWMVEIYAECVRVCKGLVAFVVEGQTRSFRYSAGPALLMADLHRKGFNLRKPPVFHRVGIPGSGGPDWLRNDWEWIVCVSRPGRLPWSDNTACGKKPKWAPGGEMSSRLSDGTRVNQWGKTVGDNLGVTSKARQADGSVSHYIANGKRKAAVPRCEAKNGDLLPRSAREQRENVEPKVAEALENGIPEGGKLTTKDNGKGEMRTQLYLPPAIANPGNVINIKVGGGLMGHPLAHFNEAPFPEALANFFTLSFCAPGGLIADPFAGSGTTLASAVKHGRRAIGCDLRESQVELTRRRLRDVQPETLLA